MTDVPLVHPTGPVVDSLPVLLEMVDRVVEIALVPEHHCVDHQAGGPELIFLSFPIALPSFAPASGIGVETDERARDGNDQRPRTGRN